MPEFFSFTLGAETNPRLPSPETSPLLVGRFRAVVPQSLGRGGHPPPPLVAPSTRSQPTRSQPTPLLSAQQRPYWNAPPSRTPSPFAAGGPRRGRGVGWTAMGRGQPAAAGHGFYNDTGYGAIAAAGYVGEDEEEEEEEDDDDDDLSEEEDDDSFSDDDDDDDDETDTVDPSQTAPPSQRYLLSTRTQRPPPRRRRQRLRRFRRFRRACSRYRYGGRRVVRWVRRVAVRFGRHLRNLWITPRNATVRRAVDRWWVGWLLLVVLPAALAVAWCAIPFPQYAIGDYFDDDGGDDDTKKHRTPGHGEARVRINFWYFLLVYYGSYNLTALVWITKVFNLYSLNWWPSTLGFPLSVSLLAAFSLVVPAGVFFGVPPAAFLASRNTAWVTWTFAVMAMPVAAALLLLLLHERHRKLRHMLSDTQRIFTTALWTGEDERRQAPAAVSRRNGGFLGPFWHGRETDSTGDSTGDSTDDAVGVGVGGPRRAAVALSFDDGLHETSSLLSHPASPAVRRPPADHWLPSSFVRFLWLMGALFTSLLVYVLGEASASLFLAALPDMHHTTAYAVAYVYAWTVTVFLLDMLTAWILGGRQGERVGSYPLGWVFKLYFMLTYQTYVRALYVRLRSPSQVVYLQMLSSTTLIVLTPLLMCPWTHRLLGAVGLNGQSYGAFQKVCVRNVFVRFVAENASMLAFLGSLVVLHMGPNRDVYPYFAFDDEALLENGYTFNFTLYASGVAWACELGAAVVVSGLIRFFYGIGVVAEAKMDLAVWPELLPTSVAVTVHVLQNMLFSIIRLQFW